jgi:hypothetical protein
MSQLIMSQSTRLRFAVATALAIAMLSQAIPSAWAFSTENLSVNQNGNSRYADPDDQVKNGQSAQPFGPGGPVVHFGAGGSQPYNRFQGSSNYNYPPPQPYAMPPGNGN